MKAQPIQIAVHPDRDVYTMRGGIGASWHAIHQSYPLQNERYKYPIREENPGGSALGGNPPSNRTDLWDQLGRHASWLGMDWLRVELSQRMYHPEENRFEWNNEEMTALYRILDWCQENRADVFLQIMWRDVAWNTYEGVHPMLSAPRSIEAYATSVGTLLDQLVTQRGYTCIKWFSLTNEPPGGTWGYWWETGDSPSITITPALKAVREELDRRGIKIELSAPDWTDLPAMDRRAIDFDPYIGAYDIHSYQGMNAERAMILKDWVDLAHERGKPLFLSEMGNMPLGWGGDNPAPKTFAAALWNAEAIVRGLRLGVDAFNRWSYTNRGDLDGQWQLVRTWDRTRKTYYEEVLPETTAYLGYGIITRFLPKYAVRVEDNIQSPEDILTASVRSANGNLTTYVVNIGDSEHELSLRLNGDVPVLYRYRLTEQILSLPEPALAAGATYTGGSVRDVIPPYSINVYSTYHLQPGDNGIIVD